MSHLAELQDALTRFEARHRMRRGRGAHSQGMLLRRLRNDEVQIDEETAQQLAYLLESAGYALDDAKSQTRRAKNEPWAF